MARTLTNLEANLRIAMLVARADGTEDAAERARTSKLLGERLARLDDAELELLVGQAMQDIGGGQDLDGILRRIATGLSGRTEAMQAMHVACQIALADNKLAWQESREVLQFAKVFGLSDDDVRSVLHTYWPVRTRRLPA